jgi:hypothetical protein
MYTRACLYPVEKRNVSCPCQELNGNPSVVLDTAELQHYLANGSKGFIVFFFVFFIASRHNVMTQLKGGKTFASPFASGVKKPH